ncbi:hypothetical protein PENTCL1PPCAC_20136 [Pristionchus entomophagus]|uniref:Ribosomal protein n=1 Tax=Pristionchus entomophagus TaxID=358040 RepID=A0AAV5TUL0_9BILA|nr:hypothetical protein PENTCL1PPCAC_20136 [Pristionchus entomophagus]
MLVGEKILRETTVHSGHSSGKNGESMRPRALPIEVITCSTSLRRISAGAVIYRLLHLFLLSSLFSLPELGNLLKMEWEKRIRERGGVIEEWLVLP